MLRNWIVARHHQVRHDTPVKRRNEPPLLWQTQFLHKVVSGCYCHQLRPLAIWLPSCGLPECESHQPYRRILHPHVHEALQRNTEKAKETWQERSEAASHVCSKHSVLFGCFRCSSCRFAAGREGCCTARYALC